MSVCPGWGGAASLCARSRGEPSSAHCEQRLSERLTPCPCDPVCACTGMRGHATKRKKRAKGRQNDAAEKPKKPCISVCAPTRSAASRAGMAGWAGEGGGRFGERREYEAPALPSTPRQHGMARPTKARQETTRHHNTKAKQETARHGSMASLAHQIRQPRNSSPTIPTQKKNACTPQGDRRSKRERCALAQQAHTPFFMLDQALEAA